MFIHVYQMFKLVNQTNFLLVTNWIRCNSYTSEFFIKIFNFFLTFISEKLNCITENKNFFTFYSIAVQELIVANYKHGKFYSINFKAGCLHMLAYKCNFMFYIFWNICTLYICMSKYFWNKKKNQQKPIINFDVLFDLQEAFV